MAIPAAVMPNIVAIPINMALIHFINSGGERYASGTSLPLRQANSLEAIVGGSIIIGILQSDSCSLRTRFWAGGHEGRRWASFGVLMYSPVI